MAAAKRLEVLYIQYIHREFVTWPTESRLWVQSLDASLFYLKSSRNFLPFCSDVLNFETEVWGIHILSTESMPIVHSEASTHSQCLFLGAIPEWLTRGCVASLFHQMCIDMSSFVFAFSLLVVLKSPIHYWLVFGFVCRHQLVMGIVNNIFSFFFIISSFRWRSSVLSKHSSSRRTNLIFNQDFRT
jgi:hypothetical protein